MAEVHKGNDFEEITMKILCFGDSNTYGYDPCSYFGGRYPGKCRWVDILAGKLDCTAINAGENGRETPSREGELLQFDQILTNHKPLDMLVIMLGSNDLLQGNLVESVVRRMKDFLEHIDMEKSRILLIGPVPMQRGEWVPVQSLVDASIELTRKYRCLTELLGVGFADAGKWNVSVTFDGVHFTEEGHKSFAEGLYQVITRKGE